MSFGAVLDAVMQIPKNMHAEEMQNDAQNFNEMEAARAREFNSAQALAQRDWQERMSNTAHQRSINDLSRAGLNPILAARSGGAVTGGAAAASGPAASSGGAVTAGPAGTNFTQAQMNSSQMYVNEATEKLLKEQTRTWHENIYKTHSEAFLAEQKAKTEQHNTERARHEASMAANSAKGLELEGEIDSGEWGELFRYLNRAMRAITGGASAYRNLRD